MPERNSVRAAIEAFAVHAQHRGGVELLLSMQSGTVLRLGDYCGQADRDQIRLVSMMLDYHSGVGTANWAVERDLEILLVLLKHNLYAEGSLVWKALEEFVYYLEYHHLISREGFCIAEHPTEHIVLGTYLYRLATKMYPTVSHAQWLGENIDRITPLMDIIKERRDASRDTISVLWQSESRSLTSGAL